VEAVVGTTRAVTTALCVVVATTIGLFGSRTVRLGSAVATATPDRLGPDERIALRALADAATVGISGRGCDGYERGSGFVVGGVTFTNRHLVAGGDYVKVDQLVAPTLERIARVSSSLDVATAPGVAVPELQFADENPSVGAAVVVAGHAGGRETVVAEGHVHLYAAGETWGVPGSVMLIDAPTEPGFSGGPVLDRAGRVVAMLQGFEPMLELTLAIPVEELRSWSASGEGSTTTLCEASENTG
jgi:S1-C subfamily serine protease